LDLSYVREPRQQTDNTTQGNLTLSLFPGSRQLLSSDWLEDITCDWKGERRRAGRFPSLWISSSLQLTTHNSYSIVE